MDDLGVKSNDGTLPPEERVELENHVRVGHFLAVMQLKARRRLTSAPGVGESTKEARKINSID